MSTNAFKVAVGASHGWRASAAGPETIFSRAGLMCTALRSGLSTWVLEMIVFLFKNKEFIPTVEEVTDEIMRIEAERRRARIAHATCASSSSSSSSSSAADAAAADVT